MQTQDPASDSPHPRPFLETFQGLSPLAGLSSPALGNHSEAKKPTLSLHSPKIT